MRKLVTAVLLLPLCALAQKSGNPTKFASTITPECLKKQLYIIASPEMEGRETATPGQKRAATYIESQFKEIGLQPGNNGSYQFYYNVYQDSLISADLQVNGQSFTLDKDFNPTGNYLNATIRIGEVVVIGSNAIDTVNKANLAGKFVLFTSNVMMGGRNANSIDRALMNKGIAGVFMVSNLYPRSKPSNRKGFQTINAYPRTIAPQQFTISEAVARAIVGKDYDNVKGNNNAFQAYPAEIVTAVNKVTTIAQSSNVIGLLPGTDLKDQYLFITAHYDHLGKRDSVIYYGADDDGSGTTTVIELARAFAKAKAAGNGPRRTIVFMTVSGEEKGLWGSEYYANHPVFPLEKTTADLNIDMIGRLDTERKTADSLNYIYVVGDDKLSSDLKPISEAVNTKYTKLNLDYKFNDVNDPNRIYYRSDHYNFAKNGVPIIFYYDGMLKADYHKPTDTPDKINYPLMAKRAQLIFYTAWDMANRNDMLKRDIPLDKNVFNR